MLLRRLLFRERASLERPFVRNLKSLVAILGLLTAFAETAFAQEVVVLQFAGDKKDKLRKQVIEALEKARKVELVPLRKFQDIATRKRFKGARAMTPAAVAAVSQSLSFSAAIEGAVADTFFVRILDTRGQELWSRELKVKKGLLSKDNANRLAKAIAAAASAAQSAEPTPPPVAEETPETTPEVEIATETPTVKSEKPAEGGVAMGLDLSEGTPTSKASEEGGEEDIRDDGETRTPVRPPPVTLSEEERERRRQAELAESQTTSEPPRVEATDEDLDQERRRHRRGPGPKLVGVQLAWLTTWRAYCSRPGVTDCQTYDRLSEESQPQGDRVDVLPKRPYGGFAMALELFPLSSSNGPVNGIGVVGNFSQAFSQTRVSVITPSGEAGDPKIVVSRDMAYQAAGTYRYYFAVGDSRLPGFVGGRVGYHGRVFEVDRTQTTSLPGARRGYPGVGLDATFPLASYARIEAGATYFVNPRPGAEEVEGYGQTASGSGYQFEGGLSGDVWGPLGYTAKFRVIDYHDQFVGEGNKWAEGGTAQETYTHLFVGATASF